MAAPRVVVLGDLNIDVGLDVPRFPAPGGDGVAHRQRLGFGGSAANTAVMLQRLGVPALLAGCIGDDPWGDLAVTALAADGVDTSAVVRSAELGTSLNIVAVTPDGERTMLAYRGASAQHRPEQLPEQAIRSASHLHISGYTLLEEPQRSTATRAAAVARAAGLTVSLDVPVDPVHAVPDLLLKFARIVDVLVIGESEARALTERELPAEMAEALAQEPGQLIALKRGADGCLLLQHGSRHTIPGLTVPVVDSTGAGDSFCAGLIVGLLTGGGDTRGNPGLSRRREPAGFRAPVDPGRLESAGALANVCGAAAVGSAGSGADLPHRTDIESLLNRLPDGTAGAIRAML